MTALRVAAVQYAAGADPIINAACALDGVAEAAAAGARVVVLPEYSIAWAPALYPELAGGYQEFESTLASAAAEHGVYVVAGSLRPQGGRLLNVAVVFGPDGAERASYAKVHLFDAFGVQESKVLDAGPPGVAAVVDIDGWRLGLATCYDLRFPETFRLLVDAGAQVFAVGAAWAAGPGKEEQLLLLARARALENTSYLILASQSGAGRCGRSLIAGPLGQELAAATSETSVTITDLDPDQLARVREQVPSLRHRRYSVVARPAQ
ncbi:MAG: nitrilase-related carbon-nitrogen hydrolase [Beutenbergiaceae bacterium]